MPRKGEGIKVMAILLRIVLGLSMLPRISRMNDDKHYFPAVASGWYFAYLRCAAVEKRADQREGRAHVQPASVSEGIAITVRKRF